MLKAAAYERHSLVSQLHFRHHHLRNVPEILVLHLLSIFGYVTEADSGDLSHVFGGELKRVSGAAAK